MTERDRHLEELERQDALHLLAPLREPLPSAELDGRGEAALRARVLRELRTQVMEQPLRQAQLERRRTLSIWLGAGAGALALAAAAMLIALPKAEPEHALKPSAPASRDEGRVIEDAQWVSADGSSHPIVQGMLVPDGSRELRAHSAAARVRTSVGAEVQLAPHTRLAVQDARAGAALRVVDGEVACSVPKLGAGTFAVDTPSARVVVHGTRFTVRVAGEARERTCVRVQEGVVAVHAHRAGARPVKLTAGESWGCDASQAQAASAGQPARKHGSARGGTTRAPVRSGTLDAENKLLADALSAERAQDRARAHALFEELLLEHPSSPLADEARAGLARTR